MAARVAAPTPAAPAPVSADPEIIISPVPVTVQVEFPATDKSLADIGTYAPALPGILVALFGLWAAHYLAQRRDRRKTVHDLCDTLKLLAGEASATAIEAWLEDDQAKRASSIANTKRLLQSAGITATTLKRRTRARRALAWARRKRWLNPIFEYRLIDLVREVSGLRRIAMADPFEDPQRRSDPSKVDAINAALAILQATVDRALFDYQG